MPSPCPWGIREWHGRGKPTTTDTQHDFREWGQALDWIVQNLFHAAPLMDGHDGAKERAANPSLTFLRSLAIKLNERHAIGQALSAGEISQFCLEEDIEIPGVRMEEQTLEQGPQQIGKIMKPLFKEGEEVTFGEFQVVRTSQQVCHSKPPNDNSVLSCLFHPFKSSTLFDHLNRPTTFHLNMFVSVVSP
jgi:hypothetical protein